MCPAISQPLETYLDKGTEISAPDGACLFSPGDESGSFLLVKSGCVRVEQTNQAGRTVVLYRVKAGDSCVLTTSGLLSGQPYAGYGYAEGDVTAVAIAKPMFLSLLASDEGFRELVFGGFASRVAELTDVIDNLLLHRADLRLAKWLSERSGDPIALTHQAIAQEVGTVREVVSRTLQHFEKRGWVTLGRREVVVREAGALADYAHDQGL